MTNISSILRSWITVPILALTSNCTQTHPPKSHTRWGALNDALSANILNLTPNQSLSICAPSEEWVLASKDAIKQWSEVIGRWNYLKITNCGETSDLVINMEGFDKSGINQYNANPGSIYLYAYAQGSFLKALTLHEYGHSFGMCDQYPSNEVFNCSTYSAEKDDTEVMGTTNATKLKLTPGDIDGVKKIAGLTELEANVVWQKFLASNPPPGNNQRVDKSSAIFVKIDDAATSRNFRMRISAPKGYKLRLCVDKSINQTDSLQRCEDNSESSISLTRDSSTSERDIYLASPSVASQQKTRFVATINSDTQTSTLKFIVNSK